METPEAPLNNSTVGSESSSSSRKPAFCDLCQDQKHMAVAKCNFQVTTKAPCAKGEMFIGCDRYFCKFHGQPPAYGLIDSKFPDTGITVTEMDMNMKKLQQKFALNENLDSSKIVRYCADCEGNFSRILNGARRRKQITTLIVFLVFLLLIGLLAAIIRSNRKLEASQAAELAHLQEQLQSYQIALDTQNKNDEERKAKECDSYKYYDEDQKKCVDGEKCSKDEFLAIDGHCYGIKLDTIKIGDTDVERDLQVCPKNQILDTSQKTCGSCPTHQARNSDGKCDTTQFVLNRLPSIEECKGEYLGTTELPHQYYPKIVKMIEDGTMKDLPGNERQALTTTDYMLIEMSTASKVPDGYRLVYYSELKEDLLYSGVINTLAKDKTLPYVVNGYAKWAYPGDSHSQVITIQENCGKQAMDDDDVVLVVKDSYFVYAGEEDA